MVFGQRAGAPRRDRLLRIFMLTALVPVGRDDGLHIGLGFSFYMLHNTCRPRQPKWAAGPRDRCRHVLLGWALARRPGRRRWGRRRTVRLPAVDHRLGAGYLFSAVDEEESRKL